MAARPDQSLSIVMPAFNEVDSLPRCVERTLAFVRKHVVDGELILVDDGSSDGTGPLIDELARREPELRSVHLERNSGMGAALLRGFTEARCEWVTILPADGQLDAFELLGLFSATDRADLVTTVYPNRRYSLFRLLISRGLRLATMMIVGARVRSDGAYLIRRDVLERLGARSPSFMLNQEIPIRARRLGVPVATVSMNVHERIAGQSKALTVRHVVSTLLDHFILRASLERDRFRRDARSLK